jgi:predicted nucleic acid-binding protein
MNRVPRVYLDAPILIYSGELDPRYWPLLRTFWDAAEGGRLSAVTSELSLLECLVRPVRVGDAAALRSFESIFARRYIELRPIDPIVLREAARLRATQPNLKTPDAIHIATALDAGVRNFFTNDRRIGAQPGLDIHLLDEDLPQFT